jgi:EmrB/QacA subfamily drug resistance transporter
MANTTMSRSAQVGLIISASLAGFMVLLDANIVNISLPVIAGYFNISAGKVVQITLVYLLVLSSSLIIFGKLAERYGVKRIFVAGFIVFTVSSLFCGITPTFYLLLLARIFQATGGAMLFATSLTLITKFIPADRRGWAFGIFSPLTSLGVLVGNPLGGLITGMLNWHWIFLVNIPVGILATILAIRTIPQDHEHRKSGEKSGPFDYAGSLLSFLGLAALVFFLSKGREIGWGSPVTLGGFLTALLLIGLFIFREKRAADPVLDLSIFSGRSFSFAILASVAGFGLMTGSNVLLPFYLSNGLHIDVEHAGFILMTFPVLFSLLSPVTGRLSDRVSKVRLTFIGMLLAFLNCLLFAWLLTWLHLGVLFIYLVFLGIAYALFITPNNNLVMSLTPESKQAVSTSLFKLSTNLGQMFGLIVMEMIFSNYIHHSSGNSVVSLKTIPQDTLVQGFSYAYLGGAALCLLAMVFTLFIKERKVTDEAAGEISFLG